VRASLQKAGKKTLEGKSIEGFGVQMSASGPPKKKGGGGGRWVEKTRGKNTKET